METQTATVKVSNGTIQLPEKWVSFLNGRDVIIARVDDMLVMKPRQDYEIYSDEEIESWKQDDLLPSETRLKIEQLLSAAY